MLKWEGLSTIPPKRLRCGFCGERVGSDKGYFSKEWDGIRRNYFVGYKKIYICPICSKPTYFTDGEQFPGVAFGNKVESLPEDIEKLYNEARQCTSVRSYTAAVMTCRKLLMNIAVNKGAEVNLSFKQYVDYLNKNHYITPDGKAWVDRIREKGNEANHEIVIMEKKDAEDLITFVEMLLKVIYEFPSKGKDNKEQKEP